MGHRDYAMTSAEIAAELGITASGVESIIHNAIVRMRRQCPRTLESLRQLIRERRRVVDAPPPARTIRSVRR